MRVSFASDASGVTHAEWVLGRTSSGLLSVVVRDASQCDVGRLRGDVTYAVAEAKRYCAVGAVILVQQGRDDATWCLDALQEAFGAEVAESDLLYQCGFTSDMPVWFACLSYGHE